MDLTFTELMGTAALICDETLAVKPGESVIILTDTRVSNYPGVSQLGQALAAALTERQIDYNIITFNARSVKHADMPAFTEEILKQADAAVVLLSQSILYSNAMRRLLSSNIKTRLLQLPLGQDMEGTDDIYYLLPKTKEEFHAVSDKTIQIGNEFCKAPCTVHLTAAGGTDMTLNIGQLTSIVQKGVAKEPGSVDGFPFGNLNLGVDEGSAYGKMVLNCRFYFIDGMIQEPLTLTVKDGYVTDIEGGKDAADFRKFMDGFPYPDNEKLAIAEFGLGFDKKARLTGKDLGECERVYGAAHIGIGANGNFGGHCLVPWHGDGIFPNANVEIDGRPIVVNGEYVI